MKITIFLMLICLPVMLMGVVGITYTFANSQLTSSAGIDYYEFDIMAQATASGTRLGTGIVLINYNTAAFGTWVKTNGKLTVTSGTLTTTAPFPIYGLIMNDNISSRFAVTFEYTIPYPGYGNILPTNPTQLIHVKLEIADTNQQSNLSFAETLMNNQQYYDDNATKYSPVVASTTLNEPLQAIGTPVAIAATAICHNGFTARWNAVTGATSYRLDVLQSDGITYVTGYQDKVVTPNLARVEFVSANTAYKYRVRAYNGSISLNSNIIDVSTTTEAQGTSASTSIGGNPVTIDVPNVTGGPPFTNNDVIVAPGDASTNDYSVVVTWHPAGYDELPNIRLVCTVTCSDNNALNGVYTINHAGMGFTPASAGYKWNGAWYIVACTPSAGSTTVTISSLAKSAKGELIIALDDGSGTLPVELSSFSAIATPQNYVMLQWVTQSETNVSGYYIFRNLVNNIGTAERINAFIPATNTSQETSYTFTDREATAGYTWYYWLQHVEMSGEFEFHGPVNLTLLDYTNTTPAIPLKTSLQQIYPNPFNPKTTISFGLAKPSDVNLIIYNAKGEIVRNLLSGYKNAGNYRIAWEGRNNDGKTMPSGVYIVRMIAGKHSSTLKLVSLK
jgi:hypothetical protein